MEKFFVFSLISLVFLFGCVSQKEIGKTKENGKSFSIFFWNVGMSRSYQRGQNLNGCLLKNNHFQEANLSKVQETLLENEVDLVALAEIDDMTAYRQIGWCLNKYHPVLIPRKRGDSNLGIYSTEPLSEVRLIVKGIGRVVSRLEYPDFFVIPLHLNNSSANDRLQTIEEGVIPLLQKSAKPTVIIGDFNTRYLMGMIVVGRCDRRIFKLLKNFGCREVTRGLGNTSRIYPSAPDVVFLYDPKKVIKKYNIKKGKKIKPFDHRSLKATFFY